jgi:peroxiredoxin
MKRIIPATFIIIFLSIPCFFGFTLDVGETAAKFANPDLSGAYILSKNVIGSGWLILDFFATDCDGCKKELPELEEIYAEFEGESLTGLIFATDTGGKDVVKPYFQANPTMMTVLIDPYKVSAKRYGVDTIPAVYLVDPSGTIVFKEVGYKEETAAEIRHLLDEGLSTGE